MNDPIGHLTRLSPQERTALFARLRGPASLTRPRGDRVPASYSQEQLWFLDQLVPGIPNYIVPFCFTLDGPLDTDALTVAFGNVVRRHDVLRTALRFDSGELLQVVEPPGDFSLPTHDLSDHPDPENAARHRCLELAREPFDLSRAPLWRCELLRLDRRGHRHMLVWIASHTIADGWSVGTLIRELASLYDGGRCDSPAKVQFADYAIWQREHLTPSRLRSLLDFWRKELADSSLLNFPYDRPRPETPTLNGRSHFFTVPADLHTSIVELSRRRGLTPFMTTLTAYQVLLAGYCGHEDIVVGIPVSGREKPQFEDLIGSLVNTIAVRTKLSGDPTFEQALDRVRNVALQAFAHQELPFGKLVQELRPARDMRFNPLCQTVFSYGSTPFTRQETELAPDLRLRYFGIPNGTMRFDLEMTLDEAAEGLAGRFDYNVDLLLPETAGRLCDRYLELLRAVVDQPDSRLSDLGVQPAVGVRTPSPAVAEPAGPPPAGPSPAGPSPAGPSPAGTDGVRTPTAQVIARLWSEALELDDVDPHADFFVLGGHSMLATQLVVRIREELGCELTLPTFFQSCTVAELADVIDAQSSGSGDDALRVIEQIEQMPDDQVEALLASLGNRPL